MSDFHQPGLVTALPRLGERPVEELEAQIRAVTPKFPVALVLPVIPSEMDRPALAGILDELCRVDYLDSLVVSLNRATPEDYERAVRYFEPYPGRRVILWSRAPAILEFLRQVEQAGLNMGTPGKGRACWLAMGFLLAEERADYMAFLDADILNFRREMLARLVLPTVDPIVDYHFVKGYYARYSDRLHGRVTRLFVSPLLRALRRLVGPDPYIRYLAAFRYPLAGEFAVQRDLASRLRLPSDWGLEIVTLFEALRHRSPSRMCQVEIAGRYDHKHQEISAADPGEGLNRMAREVGTHLLRTLAAAGVVLSAGLFKSLVAAFQREAEDAVEDSYAVAMINGLAYDRHEEEMEVQVFSGALRAAIDDFLGDPSGPPLVPNWSRVWSGVPDAAAMLKAAVAEGPS